MILKKYTGTTTEEALEAARKELGNDVILMHSREVKPSGLFSFLKKPRMEITVAKEEENDRPAARIKAAEADLREKIAKVDKARQKAESEAVAKAASAGKGDASEEPEKKKPLQAESISDEASVEKKLDNIQNLLEQKFMVSQNPPKVAEEEQPVKDKKEEAVTPARKEFDSFLKLLYKTLTANEVTETNANQLVEEADTGFSDEIRMEHILSDVYQKIILKFGKPECITPSEKGAKLIFLVGPTGVGKTTTIAKLASILKVTEHKNVAMFTTDTYRISAAEQLRTYASILGVPFAVVYQPEELKEKWLQFKDCDYIFVDTIGHSHRNTEQKELTKEFLHVLDGVADIEIYLVLSASTKYRDLASIVDTYSDMCSYRLLFTKLDETDACGNLLNIRMHTMAPMSYIANGQDVPGDVTVFDAQETVKKLLGGH